MKYMHLSLLLFIAVSTDVERVSILHLSDTHMLHRQIDDSDLPEADILIHTGDFTINGKLEHFSEFNAWLGEIKHKYQQIYVIFGNHEWRNVNAADGIPMAKAQDKLYLQSLIPNACLLLDNEMRTFKGLNIWGSSWHPVHLEPMPADEKPDVIRNGLRIRFLEWNENQRLEKEAAWAELFDVKDSRDLREMDFAVIPEKVDILLSHGPPAGIFDLYGVFNKDSHENYRYGSSEILRKKIIEVKPRVHLFGHIHEQRGYWLKKKDQWDGGVTFALRDGVFNNYLDPPQFDYPCQLIVNNSMADNEICKWQYEGAYPDKKPDLLKKSLAGKPLLILAERKNVDQPWEFHVCDHPTQSKNIQKKI